MPKLSIVIPVYNAQNYILECLNSIAKQTFTDFEVLLIDDGSSDNSKNIITEFAKSDSRFKYVYKENSGVSDTRNLGIKKACGKYLAFVDADDWLDSTMYFSMISELEKTNSEICLCSYVREYPHLNEQKKEVLPFDKMLFVGDEVKNTVLYEMLGSKSISNSAIMGSVWRIVVCREFIVNNNIKFRKDTVIGEDLLFCINTLKMCNRLCIVNKHFYHYRFTKDSSMVRYRPNQWEIGYGFNEKFEQALSNTTFEDLNELIAFDLARASLVSCEMICKPENNDKLFAKLKSISSICKNERLKNLLQYINVNALNSRDKMKVNFLKNNQSFAIYLFFTLKHKKSS